MQYGVFHPPGSPYSMVTIPLSIVLPGFLFFTLAILAPFIWYLWLMWNKDRTPLAEKYEDHGDDGEFPEKIE